MESHVPSPGSFAVGLNFKNGNEMDDPTDIRFGPACRFKNLTGLSLSFVNLPSNGPAFPQRTYSDYGASGTVFTLQATLYRTKSSASGFGALRIDDAVFWHGSLVEKADKIWPAGSKLPSVVGFALVHHKDNVGDPLAEHAIASVRFRRFILDYHPL